MKIPVFQLDYGPFDYILASYSQYIPDSKEMLSKLRKFSALVQPFHVDQEDYVIINKIIILIKWEIEMGEEIK